MDMHNTTALNNDSESAGSKYFVNSIRAGQGSPVILIHGLAASLLDWIDLIPVLSNSGYSVYALDLLGHGKSGKPDRSDEYNIDNVFSNFKIWIDNLKLDEPVIIVGHSLGGYLALLFTQKFPERVKALVLCDPFYSLNYQYSIIDTTLIEHVPKWLIRIAVDLTSLSIRNGYELPEKVREQTAADYKRAQPGIFNIAHTIEDLTSHLSSIDKPTLVLWGSKDATLATASFQKILQKMPNSRGGAIQEAGHVPHQSHSAIFNRTVMEFLVSLSTSK